MKKYLLLSVFIVGFFILFSFYQFIVFNDGKLHITVCDVGQGDAVIIRTPDGRTVLFDGGPDKKVLGCLNRAMPFWQRQVDLMILSHPHADHLNGLIDVLKRYQVRQFASEELANSSESFKALEAAVKKEGIHWQTLVNSDNIKISHEVNLIVVGPTQKYIHETSPDGTISSGEFASLELLLTYGEFRMLLTGDSQFQQMAQAISLYPQMLQNITILQQPHHGSRSGITPEILHELSPEVVTISVGEKNSYGHPAPSILTMLQAAQIKIYRTDKSGDLRLKTDGETYNIQ